MSGAAVLDTERNLVVGVVSHRYFPPTPVQDDVAYAVDPLVLTFDPFGLQLRDGPLSKRPAPQPRGGASAIQGITVSRLNADLNRALPAPDEWVGREELLAQITEDWADPHRHVTGLVGTGGEGKTTLARRWLDGLLASGSDPQPSGVFWWGFSDRPNVDEFFEEALEYIVGGGTATSQYRSSSAKALAIAGMLHTCRYMFVLDGLEVLQYQTGSRFGLLRNAELRDFLTYVAAPEHASFCLATSRIPLLDLMEYTSYVHRDVGRLSPSEGVALLRKLGVKGDDEKLAGVTEQCDGHALTLSLLGSHVASQYEGDVACVEKIAQAIDDKHHDVDVGRVLRQHDTHVSEAEREFMTLLFAFRTPVGESALDRVFRTNRRGLFRRLRRARFGSAIAALDGRAFEAMVQRLVENHVVNCSSRDGTYAAHPLIRKHYEADLDVKDREDVHKRIKDYYLRRGKKTPHDPTLEDLADLIEAVHHACRAGTYDEGFRIFIDSITQGDRALLTTELGAYEAELALLLEFFPDGDTSEEPQVSDPGDKGWILNDIAFCLMSLGRLSEAAPFYERHNGMMRESEAWLDASSGYQNLAELWALLGMLERSADAADEALTLANRADDIESSCYSQAYQAWAAHLRGDVEAAAILFENAEELQRKIQPDVQYLCSRRGIQHADHLRQAGNAAYARRITEENLEICESNRVVEQVSQCHRVLGDLDAQARRDEDARVQYDKAVEIAQGISERGVLIEALSARGNWAARCLREVNAAFTDLNEALSYSVGGGYRIYEADIRIALAWAQLAANDPASAQAEAERAKQMSVQMGYHWGQVDADEVLGQLDAGDA